MQHKNRYYLTGYIMLMRPVTSRSFTNKEGKELEFKERIIVVRHKMAKYGRWVINDITLHCSRDAVEQLLLMKVGLHVIADFSIEVISWTPKNEKEERRFQKLICTNIMSPDDKFAPHKWWLDQNRQIVKKKLSKEDEPVEKLSDLEQKRRNPEDVEYDVKDYDKTVDYSHDNSKPINEGAAKPIVNNKGNNDELPF
jgi:hypothetical protein